MGSSLSKSQDRSAAPVNNSTGASFAAAEVSAVLSDTLSQLDLEEGNAPSQLKQLLVRLDHEASRYSNSKIDDQVATEWKCSQAEAQFVSAAWKCARGAYDLDTPIADTAYCTFSHDHVLYSSIDGTVKALRSTRVEVMSTSTGSNDLLPVLVIAIRGSATKMDHVVNANSRPRPTDGFIQTDRLDLPDLAAHAGFLNSARALDDIVSQRIDSYVQTLQNNDKKPHVVFTGHSAGGAVASLLCLRYMSESTYDNSIRVSGVTFGAPPTITSHVNLARYSPGGTTLMINVINEFDPVTRADRLYMLSLVDLAKSIASRGVQLQGRTDQEATAVALDYLAGPLSPQSTFSSGYDSGLDKSKAAVGGPVWPMPRLLYQHVGPRVVLVTRLVDNEVRLGATEVSTKEFERLVFCRVAVHHKSCYGERVELLESGKFNSQRGWSF